VERIQILLTTEQLQRLRELSKGTGESMAALIRGAVDRLLAESGPPDRAALRRRALAAVGRFRVGRGDMSERHDRYFAESTET
jgi:hypothetical protein